MPQANKRKPETTPTRRPRYIGLRAQRLPYMIGGALLVAVIVLAGVAYYQQYVSPFRRVVITVDSTQIRMREFLDRIRLTGSGGIGTLQNMTNEIMIRDGAAQLGIAVSDEEVEADLRKQASGSENVTVSDAEFQEWYRQLLDSSRITNAKYRSNVRTSLLTGRLQDYLNRQIPAELEHAHVYGIFVSTYDEALEAKERITAGEDFAKVALDVSIDATGEKGGELDWFPQSTLVMGNFDPFSLKAGEVSDPYAVVGDPETPPSAYYVVLVTEFAMREVSSLYVPEIQSKRFQDWLADQNKLHEIKWNYNSEIDAWVNWQISKLNPTQTASSGS